MSQHKIRITAGINELPVLELDGRAIQAKAVTFTMDANDGSALCPRVTIDLYADIEIVAQPADVEFINSAPSGSEPT